ARPVPSGDGGREAAGLPARGRAGLRDGGALIDPVCGSYGSPGRGGRTTGSAEFPGSDGKGRPVRRLLTCLADVAFGLRRPAGPIPLPSDRTAARAAVLVP